MLKELKENILNKHLIFILDTYENFFSKILHSVNEELGSTNIKEYCNSNKQELFCNNIKKVIVCDKIALLESQDINGLNLFITFKKEKIKIKITINDKLTNKFSICIGINNIYLDKDKTSIAPDTKLVKSIFANYNSKEYKFNILKKDKIKNSNFGPKEVYTEVSLAEKFFDLRFEEFTNYLKDGKDVEEIENAIAYYALINDDSMLFSSIIEGSNIKGIIERESLCILNVTNQL